jgi:hypothetical protein
MNASAFLPRSESKVVFVVVMVCYATFASRFLQAIEIAFGLPVPPIGTFLGHRSPAFEFVALVLAPLIESFFLIGIIELLRWLRLPAWLLVACSAVIFAFLDGSLSIQRAFVIAPGWVIMSIAYVMWRRVSWKIGFVIVASIHAFLNSLAAIVTIGYVFRHN